MVVGRTMREYNKDNSFFCKEKSGSSFANKVELKVFKTVGKSADARWKDDVMRSGCRMW